MGYAQLSGQIQPLNQARTHLGYTYFLTAQNVHR
jgi:hypothetical protein